MAPRVDDPLDVTPPQRSELEEERASALEIEDGQVYVVTR